MQIAHMQTLLILYLFNLACLVIYEQKLCDIVFSLETALLYVLPSFPKLSTSY